MLIIHLKVKKKMGDIDELCDSFSSSVKTIDEEEIDILSGMLEGLYRMRDSKDLRAYMNGVNFHMNRYYHNFINNIFDGNKDFNYLHEIKNSCNKFRSMWLIFTANEKKSTPQDLDILRKNALDCFSWLMKSLEEYNVNKDDPDPYGDLEEENYDPYDENYDPNDLTEGMTI